MAIADGMIE